LIDRKKQKMQKKINDDKIWKDNQILLNKITNINDVPGKLNPYSIERRNFRPLKSNGSIMKERQNRKIEHENYEIMKRIQSANTFYSNYKFRQSSRQHEEWGTNISQNARRTIKPESAMGDSRSLSIYRPSSRISGHQIQSASSMNIRKKNQNGPNTLDSTDAWNFQNVEEIDKQY